MARSRNAMGKWRGRVGLTATISAWTTAIAATDGRCAWFGIELKY